MVWNKDLFCSSVGFSRSGWTYRRSSICTLLYNLLPSHNCCCFCIVDSTDFSSSCPCSSFPTLRTQRRTAAELPPPSSTDPLIFCTRPVAGFTLSQRYGFGLALDEDQSQILRGVRQPGDVVMFTGHGDGRLDGIGFAARVGRTIKGYSTSRKWPCFRFA